MRGRMSENDAKVVRDVVSIVAENESLRAELAATKEAALTRSESVRARPGAKPRCYRIPVPFHGGDFR